MKLVRNGLTWLLAVALTITMIPVSFAGSAGNAQDVTAECVMYNLLDMPVYVSSDAEMAQDAPEQYKLFDDDGNYTIELEDNSFFPYEVLFAYQSSSDGEWVKTREWFDTPESTVEVAGHTFSVHSEMNDPDKISQFGVYVGDDYVAARPAEKEFSDSQISPNTLIPHDENYILDSEGYTTTIDLSSYLPEELKSVSIKTIFADTNVNTDGKKIAIAQRYSSDDYTILDGNTDAIDLSKYVESYRHSEYFKVIVGNTLQLDINNNEYYKFQINLPSDDLAEYIDAEIYSENNGLRKQVTIWDKYNYRPNNGSIKEDSFEFRLDPESYEASADLFMSLKFNDTMDKYNASNKVFKGYYSSLEELNNDKQATEITDTIWNVSDMESKGSGYSGKFKNYNNVAITITDGMNYIRPFYIMVYDGYVNINASLYLNSKQDTYVDYRTRTESKNGIKTFECSLYKEYPSNSEYYLYLHYTHPDPSVDDSNYGINLIDKVVLGHYDNVYDIQNSALEDLTESLFSVNGYKANYSGNGVNFTILDIYGEIFKITVKTIDGDKNKSNYSSEQRPYSSDIYFRVNGAVNSDNGSVDTYVMPYEHDGYYYNGFQTILTTATDVSALKPVFWSANKKSIFATGNEEGAVAKIQQSGDKSDTTLDFTDDAVEYSVTGDDQKSIKNYWVTFVPRHEGGAKLFVNGTNGAAVSKDKDGNKIITREIFLTDKFEKYHDIFIANVGDEKLTGLTAKLSDDAENVKLDDYWTVGGENNNTLAAFTKVNKNYGKEGELDNVAKIRLVPDGDGMVSGKLTISADGQEDVVIKLVGVSGTPTLRTDAIPEAVKYVPYSALLQTSNMNSSNNIVFNIKNGYLPPGVSLLPNGEIYGVPTAIGTYNFTVNMKCEYTSMFTGKTETLADTTKQFTLKVLDNTDANVDSQTDEGYSVQVAVPEEISDYETDHEFKVEGVIDEFQDFWLDGKKLVKDTDYKAESGSTKITVMKQTFKNAGSGKHTIAAEFRNSNKELKRAAQNYTSKVSSSGGGSGGGGSASATAPSYSISKGTTQNGTLKISPENAAAGKTVTITATPNAGYETVSVTVKDAKGNSINVVKNANGTYTFVMPSSKVTVSSEFKATNVSDLYDDVRTNDWFYPEVKWATEAGYMNGTGNKRFTPNGKISESAFVQVLSRLAKADTSKYTSDNYEDIESGKWYSDAAKWARAVGILGNERFSAIPPCERGKLAVMIVRYFDSQGINYAEPEGNIVIADESKMSAEELRAFRILVNAGIFKGKGNNVMDPAGATTRAELTTLLHRISDYTDLNKAM